MPLPVDCLIAPPKGWKPDWLISEFSIKIIDALGADNVCFVGGAVRDSLLGLAVSDVDLATSHVPEDVQRLLGEASIKAIPTGLKHGTITAVRDGASCEITTLRRDVSTDGRRADVEFTDDWQTDAERRDFTVNAIYATPKGVIFDPVGGFSDLQQKRVRFIGNAGERIAEDALRILRFYRFSARFADQIDKAGQAACMKYVDMLDRLSVERIRDELLKILTLEEVMPIITCMQEGLALQQIFGDNWSPAPIYAYCTNEVRLEAPIDPLVRLYVLSSSQLSATEMVTKFKLSNDDRRFLLNVERASKQAMLETEKDIRRTLYLFGRPATLAATIVQGQSSYSTAFRLLQEWSVPDFPVKGQDLIEQGAEAGPKLGDMLAHIEKRWIESDFSLTRDQLLEMQ